MCGAVIPIVPAKPRTAHAVHAAQPTRGSAKRRAPRRSPSAPAVAAPRAATAGSPPGPRTRSRPRQAVPVSRGRLHHLRRSSARPLPRVCLRLAREGQSVSRVVPAGSTGRDHCREAVARSRRVRAGAGRAARREAPRVDAASTAPRPEGPSCSISKDGSGGYRLGGVPEGDSREVHARRALVAGLEPDRRRSLQADAARSRGRGERDPAIRMSLGRDPGIGDRQRKQTGYRLARPAASPSAVRAPS